MYVDESGCEKRIGFRRTGRSELEMTRVQVSRFHLDQRYLMLPIYGTVFYRVFRGSTDVSVFGDFNEQMLQHCGNWPELKLIVGPCKSWGEGHLGKDNNL